MRTACLIGNGVSIAYNPALTVPNLTTELIQRLQQLAGGDAETALSGFAHQIAAIPGEQFEALLGPLTSSAAALEHIVDLAPLAAFAPEQAVVDGVTTTADFLRQVHRLGLGTVLGSIAGHATGKGDAFHTVTEALADALIALGPAGSMTLATLNYDGLTHAGLMEMGQDMWGQANFLIADLASGQAATAQQVLPGTTLAGHWLRDFDDIPTDRAALLHLHGYLGWLRQPETGQVAKFTLDGLRDCDYWQQFAAGACEWEPVVVLTDRKDRATLEWPISLAYQTFLTRLVAAERWLIAGYGLGDAPVNNLYRTAVRSRARSGLGPARVLYVGLGPDDPDAVASQARQALGLPSNPSVSMAGVPVAFASQEWDGFAAP
ncbi:MAG: SIR2 family protein [Acidimicrobiia bacterium]|nr:SIR2 family protein [Acidimicrobiia bacterium]